MNQDSEFRISSTELDLQGALNLLSPLADQYRWRLLELEGVGDLSPMSETMLGLERQIAARPEGKEVSWGWLSDLAGHLKGLINFRLVGDAGSGQAVEVELFDSSYWTIRADEHVSSELEKGLAVR